MNRYKKELIRRVNYLQSRIMNEMLTGVTPARSWVEMDDESDECEEKLARLRHYTSAEEMQDDMRRRVRLARAARA